jgi:hypothetical protein
MVAAAAGEKMLPKTHLRCFGRGKFISRHLVWRYCIPNSPKKRRGERKQEPNWPLHTTTKYKERSMASPFRTRQPAMLDRRLNALKRMVPPTSHNEHRGKHSESDSCEGYHRVMHGEKGQSKVV